MERLHGYETHLDSIGGFNDIVDIHVEKVQIGADSMRICDQGFDDFSSDGLQKIHMKLFGDSFAWAGQFRRIRLEHAESALANRSVWYSAPKHIAEDLNTAFSQLRDYPWREISREQFVHQLSIVFSSIWQVHPFYCGNTAAVLVMLVSFVEHNGFHVDRELLSASINQFREGLVMASLDQLSVYGHLERVLLDVVGSKANTGKKDTFCIG